MVMCSRKCVHAFSIGRTLSEIMWKRLWFATHTHAAPRRWRQKRMKYCQRDNSNDLRWGERRVCSGRTMHVECKYLVQNVLPFAILSLLFLCGLLVPQPQNSLCHVFIGRYCVLFMFAFMTFLLDAGNHKLQWKPNETNFFGSKPKQKSSHEWKNGRQNERVNSLGFSKSVLSSFSFSVLKATQEKNVAKTKGRREKWKTKPTNLFKIE